MDGSSNIRTVFRAASLLLCAATLGIATLSQPAFEVRAAVPSADSMKAGTDKDLQSFSRFCGSKKITIGYVDSTAGANSWRKITHAELLDEAKKCSSIGKIISTDGQGSLTKTISDVQGLVAQRVDGIVLLGVDFGSDLLPVVRRATRAGIPVVVLLAYGMGGTPGADYVDLVNANEPHDGAVRTAWLSKVLHGKGNVISVGGTPGNPLSRGVFEGVQSALQQNPGIKLLVDHPIDTNFSPADEQKAVAAALARFSEIDGVQNECGTCVPGGLRAFQAANRPLVAWTSDDNNEVSCLYYKLKPGNPKFEILTTAARNWLSRVALHKVVAKAEGLPNDEPSTFNMRVVEDTTNPKLQPKCDASAPPGAIFSSHLSRQEVLSVVK